MAFTKEQQDAIVAMRPLVCVTAGAGSGKTTILVERITHLLSHPECWQGASPHLDKIAAITFTDKAAAEMKARLRRRFREMAPADDPAKLRFWRDMERQVDGARISTIHAFCATLLREHALHLGMDPDWKVLADAESAQLSERVITDVLQQLLENGDPAVFRLSLAMSRSELKRTLESMLVRRWDYLDSSLVEECREPETLAASWKQRLPVAHAAFLRSLSHSPRARAHHERLQCLDGRCSDPENPREKMRAAYAFVLESLLGRRAEAASLLKALFTDFQRLPVSKKNWLPEDYEAAGAAIKEAKAWIEKTCLLPEWQEDTELNGARMTCDLMCVFQEVEKAFREARRAWSSVDYDDMINETLALLRNNEHLRGRVAGSLRFLLMDEFQDTDGRQLEVAHLLTNHPGGPDLFLVGDAKQSIYYFRGAEVSLFREELGKDARAIALDANFRTLPDVLHFVNDFFARSRLLDAVEGYTPMAASRPAMGTPRVEFFLPEGQAEKSGAPEKRDGDAKYIAARIREMCLGDSRLLLPEKNGKELRAAVYDDIVLLFRRGSYMHEYESALRNAGIPYNRIAGAGFFRRREIQDVLAMLQVVCDPWDEEALLTVLRSPLAGLSDESLMRMAMAGGGVAVCFHGASIPEHFDQQEALEQARRLFLDLHARREWLPGPWLRRLLDITRYEAVLLSQHLGLQRVSNLRKLVQMADNFSQSRPAALPEFTRYLEEVSFRELHEGEAGLQSRGMGAVTLMSIHKAKGLEFPIVFLPEMFVDTAGKDTGVVCRHPGAGMAVKASDGEGQLVPGAYFSMLRLMGNHEENMELARILYVAMTRARDYLVLCGHPEAPAFSWAGLFNRLYRLPEQDHGAQISGTGWKAVVNRRSPAPKKTRQETATVVSPDVETIRRRLEPSGPGAADIRVISVSELLYRMGLGENADDDGAPVQQGEKEAEPASAAMRLNAMNRGTLVHRLFELWDFQGDIIPDLGLLVYESGMDQRGAGDTIRQLESILDGFRRAPAWPLFSRAARVDREMPFLLNLDGVIVRGVVDAVIDNAVVVDYKTGKPDPRSGDRYETQVLLYGAALWKLAGICPERGLLCYVDCGQACEIAMDVARLEEVLHRATQCLKNS